MLRMQGLPGCQLDGFRSELEFMFSGGIFNINDTVAKQVKSTCITWSLNLRSLSD